MSEKPTDAKTADEQPKKVIAKRVVTPKQRYFNPVHGSVEAESNEDAVEQFKKLTKKKAGDGESISR